jgi:alpha-D-ribose 1-methylphosphonate 5-triphosphate synthase subunit PhnG
MRFHRRVINSSLQGATKLSINIDNSAKTTIVTPAFHKPASDPPAPEGVAARRAAMAVLVEATADQIASLLASLGALPAHEIVRPPEPGLVMVQGRIGGDGSPFNVGEATVTRAAIRLAGGEMGFAYVLGRDLEKARLVALCDALMQSAQYRPALEDRVVAPLRARIDEARRIAATRTAATRVDFLTLVRGED